MYTLHGERSSRRISSRALVFKNEDAKLKLCLIEIAEKAKNLKGMRRAREMIRL